MAILRTALSRAGGKPGMFLINRNEVVARIEMFRTQTEQKIENGIIRMAQKFQSLVQDKTPVETGDLKASIIDYGVKIEKGDGKYRAEIGTSLEYAPYVEYGVEGRTYNYHRIATGNVSGVGAGMFRKTMDSASDNKLLEAILIDALS